MQETRKQQTGKTKTTRRRSKENNEETAAITEKINNGYNEIVKT